MKKILNLGLLLAIIAVCPVFAQSVNLIPAGSSWKYLDNGTNQGTAWRGVSFSDASWASGNAQLGYGDGDETTVVSYGSNATLKYVTTYFRKSFSVSTPSSYSSLTISLMRDDGAVVYLNGTEVARSNMPSGTISYTTLASTSITGTGESTYYTFSVAPSLLLQGTNVIAVELHQVTRSSPDLTFNFKLDATQTASCGTPGGLTVSNRTSNSASVSCTSVSGATGYALRYRVNGTTTYTTTNSTSPSWSLTGLASGTKYEYSIQAICSGTSGAFSPSSFFSTYISGNDSLITTNSSWKYLDNGTNQGTAWYGTSFSDAAWLSGNAELGYGDGDESKVVGYGPDANNKYITTYFRKSFTVNDPQIYAALTLSVVRDDGIVVYLNGAEVYRNNMPTGAISYTTLAPAAISSTDESAWYTTTVPVSALLTGNNVIAVEIHQQAVTSSDISFKARLWGSGSAPLPVITRGAYLQKLTPSSVTIRWRTDVACDSKVSYGTTLSYGSAVTNATATTEHSITLTGLQPNTRYYYAIGTTAASLQGNAVNNFYTAPVSGTATPLRVWVTGDFGNGSTQQNAVRDAFMNYTGTTPVNLWIWLGDNAYASGTDAEYQSNVFTRYPDQLKSFPLYPSPGNHDYANVGFQSASSLTTNFPYFSIFTVPQAAEAGGVASNTPKYYSYNYANIHFISLDSYGALNNSTSAMYTWLNNDLNANTQRWTVVYFHHPPYTMGSHNSDTETELISIRNNIIPLLESKKVDLILSGHSHVNERSYLIKGHFGLAASFTSAMKVSTATNTFTKTSPFDGTVYAVCGTSGQNPGTVQAGYPMPCMYFSNNTNNCSLVLDVNGDNLSCKYLTSTGTIADQFTITKNGVRLSQSPDQEQVTVTSNPFGSSVMVNCYLEQTAPVNLEVITLTGQTVYSAAEPSGIYDSGFHRFELDLSDSGLRAGIYLVRLRIGEKSYYEKVILGSY